MGIRNWVLKLLLSGSEIERFFISGGYSLIHSSEEARKYQASLNRNIAYQNGIPYTGDSWNNI